MLSTANFAAGTSLGIDTTDGDFTCTDTPNGPLGLTVFGTHTLVLPFDSTFSGGMDLKSGTLEAERPNALGDGGVTVNGGTLGTW